MVYDHILSAARARNVECCPLGVVVCAAVGLLPRTAQVTFLWNACGRELRLTYVA